MTTGIMDVSNSHSIIVSGYPTPFDLLGMLRRSGESINQARLVHFSWT